MSWKTARAAEAWSPLALPGVKTLRHRIARVIRDYGMRERREAPQYYPAAPIESAAFRTATAEDEWHQPELPLAIAGSLTRSALNRPISNSKARDEPGTNLHDS